MNKSKTLCIGCGVKSLPHCFACPKNKVLTTDPLGEQFSDFLESQGHKVVEVTSPKPFKTNKQLIQKIREWIEKDWIGRDLPATALLTFLDSLEDNGEEHE